ncbi:MAG: hypothetical protein NXI31_19300 [bacterium]|nr:hypothetical protein [bacterium]
MTGSAPLLVMRRGGLGDTLLMLPLLRCLRREHGDRPLHFAGVTEFAAPLLDHGAVDAVTSVESLALWQPDRARERLAPFWRVTGDVPEVCDDVLTPQRLARGVPAGLQLARQVGREPRWPEDSWLVAPRDGGVPGGAVWLAPGSGGRAKCAPRERWLALAGEQPEGRRVVVVVGPTEVERDDPRQWSWPREVDFFVGSVQRLAAQLPGAAEFWGNDSGPTHLAAMLGVPTTVFFTVTDPAVWAPVGPHVTVVDGR